ncbi:MAG: isochorismatase family protein [Phycisphaerae bacterium]
MIRQLIKTRRKQVLIDISTQKDFFLANGKACIRNHRRVLVNLRRVMAWARHNNLPIISTCQVYPNNNGCSEVSYCLDGTEGQRKIRYTLVDNHISFPADGSTDLPIDLLKKYHQIILNKRCADPFDEPRIERLLSDIKANEFILIGANAEDAVLATALGLLQRNKNVTVIADAIGCQNRNEADLAFRKIQAKGAQIIETKKLAGISHLRTIGICDCDLCRSFAERAFSHSSPN